MFFSATNYAEEFDAIFQHGRLPGQPTIYVCASDRGDAASADAEAERLFVLVNAPARAAGADAGGVAGMREGGDVRCCADAG